MVTSSRYKLPVELNQEEQRFHDKFLAIIAAISQWDYTQTSTASFIIDTLHIEVSVVYDNYNGNLGVPNYQIGKALVLFWVLQACRDKGIGNHKPKLLIKRVDAIKTLGKIPDIMFISNAISKDNSIVDINKYRSTMTIVGALRYKIYPILKYILPRVGFGYDIVEEYITIFKEQGQ